MEKRKVIFRLGDIDGYIPDLSPEEQEKEEDREKERVGIFHCWAPCLEHNPKIDKLVPAICAIVEDEDGKLHDVSVGCIVRFCEPLLRQV